MRELGREGGVAWLAERLRRGDLERWRIELAAYCGDAEARLAAPLPLCRDCADEDGWCPNRDLPCDDRDFTDWLRGLERWPGALLRAAIAAAWACWDEWGGEDKAWIEAGLDTTRRSDPYEALLALKAWADDPSEESLDAVGLIGVTFDEGTLGLLPVARERWWASATVAVANESTVGCETGIHAASELIGEQRVREAICGRLIEWALR